MTSQWHDKSKKETLVVVLVLVSIVPCKANEHFYMGSAESAFLENM